MRVGCNVLRLGEVAEGLACVLESHFAKPVLYAVCFNFLCGEKIIKSLKNRKYGSRFIRKRNCKS
jgi:hypothetical protein